VMGTGGLVTIGETMGLLQAEGYGPLRHAHHLRLAIAGAESNVAIGVRRLGHSAVWIGRLGDDDMADLVEATLLGEGIGLIVERDVERPTGLMIKSRRTSSTTKVTYYRAGSAASALDVHDLPLDVIASAAVLHVTGITPALSPSCQKAIEAAVHHARNHDTLVSFDVNHRTALWAESAARPVLQALASNADILFAGHDEAALLLGLDHDVSSLELAKALTALGPQEVIIKRGPAGALSLVNGSVREEQGLPVAAVDHVGAGDAFVAGYLAALMDGATAEERLRTANTTGAFAVTVSGDWEGAPTRRELALLEHADGTVLR
jgi:2-dehydro-3-deoxygluconokinase